MSNLHLVTGHAGKTHVTSADFGSFWAALFGDGTYVLDKGSKFAASKVSDNLVKIADGDMLMQGRHVRIPDNEYAELTIATGTQGYKRKDLIVARYTKNADSGVEEADLVVLIGEPKAADPVDPAYVTGDIIKDGTLQNDVPLYRVHIDGVEITGIDTLFAVTMIPYNSILAEFAGIKEMLTAGTGAKIQTGSYTGTGTGTTQNTNFIPNSITFAFVPKMVFVLCDNVTSANGNNASLFNCAGTTNEYLTNKRFDFAGGAKGTVNTKIYTKFENTTLSWYSTTNDYQGGRNEQLNLNGVEYYWFAIG